MPVTQEIQEQMLKEAYSATPNYSIDYNDPRFGKVESDKNQALTQLEQTYAGMIGQTDRFYDEQKQLASDWATQQSQIQQQQTDFAIEKIEQEKEQAHKDYLKEQSGAYVDWQKQSNQYGTNAEQMASAGLTNTGFAESSQVGMYNAYQNRVAMARESYNKAVLNYNNSIKDAMLQNNAALAEIAYQALQQQLELSLEGFQYKNQLILEQSNKKIELDNMYYNRYQDVLSQINTENAIKEDIRQYNETQKWQTEQADKNREHDKTMADIEYNYQVKRDEATRTFQAAQAELDRKHEIAVIEAKTTAEKAIADKEWEIEQERIKKEHENKIALIDHEYQKQKELEEAKNKPITTVTTPAKGTVKYDVLYGTKGKTVSDQAFLNLNNKKKAAAFTGSTYNEAVSYLKSKGKSTAGILTASDWSRRKSSYSMTGIGNASVKNYSSYAAYLRDYVNYTVNGK